MNRTARKFTTAVAAALTAGILCTGALAVCEPCGWCTLDHDHSVHSWCTANHDHCRDGRTGCGGHHRRHGHHH